MGIDIQWVEVEWKRALEAYEEGDFPEPFTDALEEEEKWISSLEDTDEQLALLGSWNGWLEFNDGLLTVARGIYDRLSADFPRLRDLGVLWDEKLAPRLPKDLEDDPEALLFAAFSPQRTKEVLLDLAAVDTAALKELIDQAVALEAVELFESGEEFVEFFCALRRAFERAARRSRGFVAWAG
jgi:hypothetical protein